MKHLKHKARVAGKTWQHVDYEAHDARENAKRRTSEAQNHLEPDKHQALAHEALVARKYVRREAN